MVTKLFVTELVGHTVELAIGSGASCREAVLHSNGSGNPSSYRGYAVVNLGQFEAMI